MRAGVDTPMKKSSMVRTMVMCWLLAVNFRDRQGSSGLAENQVWQATL